MKKLFLVLFMAALTLPVFGQGVYVNGYRQQVIAVDSVNANITHSFTYPSSNTFAQFVWQGVDSTTGYIIPVFSGDGIHYQFYPGWLPNDTLFINDTTGSGVLYNSAPLNVPYSGFMVVHNTATKGVLSSYVFITNDSKIKK